MKSNLVVAVIVSVLLILDVNVVNGWQTEVPVEQLGPGQKSQVMVEIEGDQATVKLGKELFTQFVANQYDKPILYPVLGPGQVSMTRNFPMKDDVEGEAHDHPHHKSLWVGHEISGVDFWGESAGKVVTSKIEPVGEGAAKNAFRATSEWIRKDNGETLLTDQTTWRFGTNENSRWIDGEIKFLASHGDFQFDDTKEGLFAIRTHPDLRLTARPNHGVLEVFGSAVNSEGVTGKEIWGKPAKWLLYSGKIDGRPMAIAMYDHPTNLRHPTTWHARDYGLVTANPFGLHHFLKQEPGAGAYTVKDGESLSLRYRVEFFQGKPSVDEVTSRYGQFAAE